MNARLTMAVAMSSMAYASTLREAIIVPVRLVSSLKRTVNSFAKVRNNQHATNFHENELKFLVLLIKIMGFNSLSADQNIKQGKFNEVYFIVQ